jgi:hypothetical protein
MITAEEAKKASDRSDKNEMGRQEQIVLNCISAIVNSIEFGRYEVSVDIGTWDSDEVVKSACDFFSAAPYYYTVRTYCDRTCFIHLSWK